MTLSDFNVLAKWSYGRPLCDSLHVYETARTLLEIHPFLAAINFHLANFDPQSLTARLKFHFLSPTVLADRPSVWKWKQHRIRERSGLQPA